MKISIQTDLTTYISCSCKNGTVHPSFNLVGCKCCKELSTLFRDKLDGTECILHADFIILCLTIKQYWRLLALDIDLSEEFQWGFQQK